MGMGTSLVAQWLGVRLPVQGAWVPSLVQEDPTCRGAAGPVCHGCWTCALEPTGPQLLGLRATTAEARAPTPCSATGGAAAGRGPCAAMGGGPCSPQLERACTQRRGPNTAKSK